MPDGDSSGLLGPTTVDQFKLGRNSPITGTERSAVILGGNSAEIESGLNGHPMKDPRKIARKYQLDLCHKAIKENIIVCLETGGGKTHIAVLLIQAMGHLISKPENVCVFLAPTVALVQQQARVIEESLGFNVGIYCGGSGPKSHRDWEKEVEQHEVLVMTPQILLRNLHHCFIKMESISLLVFDECHHAQANSSHPYAQIMKVFYKPDAPKVPRIFGMTASPVVGKGASDPDNLPKCLNNLENLLNAKVHSVENRDELEMFISSPVVRVYHYGPADDVAFGPNMIYHNKLEEIRRQCISIINRNTSDHKKRQRMKRLLIRLHANIISGFETLGLCGALQATRLLLTGDQCERNELIDEDEMFGSDSLCDKYLTQAATVLASDTNGDEVGADLSSTEVLIEPLFSKKLLRLIGILSSFRLQPNMKCIVFVNRIIIARALSFILRNLKFLASWRCDYLAGAHSGLKTMSRKNMNAILDKFRCGELNLLVATKVGEEGLDIQTCCLVVRFDLPESVASFIQSRGRARMPKSEYAFLVDSGNQKELDLIENFKIDEDRMNKEIVSRTSNETVPGMEERIYKVNSTGACITAGYSITLIHYYCSKLPHDEFFDPKPEFYFFDDVGGTICVMVLPSNAPIQRIVSEPQSSADDAKRDVCLQAVEELHKLGVFNDYLLPAASDEHKGELLLDASDSDTFEDDDSRSELHEMLVPSIIREPWDQLENYVQLHCYYIKLMPNPEDRAYRQFGLFIKSPLPMEAEKMELELHLAHSRSVQTKLLPAGLIEFYKDEILLAQKFQEMSLKVMLQRSDFVPQSVSLGGKSFPESGISTHYLLLPVSLGDYDTVTVDWLTIRRCLSSPIFDSPETVKKELLPESDRLQLADGCWSVHDVENSFVYGTHSRLFYFVKCVVQGSSSHSPFTERRTSSNTEQIHEKIHLKHPEQPLLRLKPLCFVRNLLHSRKLENAEAQDLEEYFIDMPPELCELKILGFSKDIGSSLSLLPSIMHRLENLLVAIELKHVLSASFPEADKVTADRILEALTTEKCQERLSLERLEILGDAFLKFAVGRQLFLLHGTLDEGELTRRRSNAVNNSNLFKLAIRSNLQIYIRDRPFDPTQFFALGRPCPIICDSRTEVTIHSQHTKSGAHKATTNDIRCRKGHHWLRKKTIADVVEALVGAFIVDSGFKAAAAFLRWIGIQVEFEELQVQNVFQASKNYLPLAAHVDIAGLENQIGYQFLHKGLLLQAFVHPSYNKHGGGCYQRLEFLGDAVLDYLMTSYTFSVYPKLKPGHLTDLRSAAVNNEAFADIAVKLSLHKFILCNSEGLSEAIKDFADFHTSSSSGSTLLNGPKSPKALGDLVESCVGAILLDSGFDLNCVWKLMLSFLDPVKTFSNIQPNPLREIKELCQAQNLDLQFISSKKGGMFTVQAKVNEKHDSQVVSATNSSKKDATKNAARLLFQQLKAEGLVPKSRSLDDVLRTTRKMDAKLIGYDENPIVVAVPDIIQLENLTLEEPSSSHLMPCSSSIPEENESYLSPSKAVERVSLENSAETYLETHSQTTCSSVEDAVCKKTYKSRLYEACAINCWKAPVFDCCNEEGAGHLKSFSFKVAVVIEDEEDEVLYCFGIPQGRKKDAAESAAEGAIWYLETQGYLKECCRGKDRSLDKKQDDADTST